MGYMNLIVPIVGMLLSAGVTAQAGWKFAGRGPGTELWRSIAFDDVRGHVLLYGGGDFVWRWYTFYGDLWAYDGVQWNRLVGGRTSAFASMAFDSRRGVAVVYGGSRHQYVAETDTLEWDGTQWKTLAGIPGSTPERGGHAMTYDSKRGLVMLFGVDAACLCNELWSWDGVSWRLVASGSQFLNDHAMCYDEARDRLVVFGGKDRFSRSQSDTWEWDGAQWQLRTVVVAPSPRFRHSMVYDKARARTVLGGGVVDGPILQFLSPETWEWDGNQWSRILVQATGWADAPMTYDSKRQRVVRVGGYSGGILQWPFPIPVDYTWEYYTPNPAAYAQFGTGCAGSVGIPLLQPTPASALPWLGDRFELELTPVPTNANVAWNIGFSKTQWGPLVLPAPLGIIGMPGCSLLASGDVSLSGTVSGNRATLALQLPTSIAHVGLTFYNQAFVLDPAANQLGVISSNAGEGKTGAR